MANRPKNHHLEVWPIRDRIPYATIATTLMALITFAIIERLALETLLLMFLLVIAERAYTKAWLRACSEAGIREDETVG